LVLNVYNRDMDTPQINSSLTENIEPKDEKLIALLKKAYKGEVYCRMAVADMSVIQPFSDYQVTISDEYRNYFKEQSMDDGGSPPSLCVYAQDGKLIMSDDYSAYAMYKELKKPKAICMVVGDTPPMNGVVYHGEYFKLPSSKL
jgi:hypothetical protein